MVPQLPSHKIFGTFASLEHVPGLNALSIGSAVFQIEQAFRTRRVAKVRIPIYFAKQLRYDLARIYNLIRELLVFTIVEDVDIEFVEKGKSLCLQEARNYGSCQNVCLFSGGVDSYSGLLKCKEALGSVVGVFCAHSDQSRIIHIVERLARERMSHFGINIKKIGVPMMGARGYAQLRGFLYILTAAAWLHILGANRLVITECGPTMYQPRFSPLDAITMTTHPVVVNTAHQLIALLLRRDVEILTPFENLTKAEVVAISPAKEYLKWTHSCISQRFGSHDGTCYGCVIRRLATISANVNDVHYARDPIGDADANSGNLLSLLIFCHDILARYSSMEEYETGMIEVYSKQDLFRRFALDNFAAIHRLLREKRKVQQPVRQIYESLVATLGTRLLDKRIEDLQNGEFAPAF